MGYDIITADTGRYLIVSSLFVRVDEVTTTLNKPT